MSARRSGRARELRQILIGVALLAAVLEGQQLFGMITSDDRLDPAFRDATGAGRRGILSVTFPRGAALSPGSIMVNARAARFRS
jgi:hypothetical protein